MDNNETMASETIPSYRVGVLGAAKIAKKNCRAASHPSTSCSIVAVASRSEEKGSDFVNEIFTNAGKSAPAVVSGEKAYLDLLADSTGSFNLDAVYIPLPTKLHEKYVLEALSSGYHVLLEKPVADSANSYRRMLNAASASGKFLQDGTMFVHHPRTKEIVNAIPNPDRVSFNFTFNGDDDFFKNDVRIKNDGDFMGCIGDLGWYCVRMGLLVFTRMDAKALRGIVTDVQVLRYRLNDDGVPIDADCMVNFTEVCSLFRDVFAPFAMSHRMDLFFLSVAFLAEPSVIVPLQLFTPIESNSSCDRIRSNLQYDNHGPNSTIQR